MFSLWDIITIGCRHVFSRPSTLIGDSYVTSKRVTHFVCRMSLLSPVARCTTERHRRQRRERSVFCHTPTHIRATGDRVGRHSVDTRALRAAV